jgi:hypothetical protein
MLSNPSGTVAYNFIDGGVWYGENPLTGNWTVNLVNVPTDEMFAMGITIVTRQATSSGLPTGFQINGAGQTIRWAGGSTPSASTAGRVDVTTFSFVRIAGSWIVTGSNSSFG